MTRNQYLQLRSENNLMLIAYFHFIETSGIVMSFNDFHHYFNQWIENIHLGNLKEGRLISHQIIFNEILKEVIDYYDMKFTIVYMTIEKKVTKIEKITFLL